MALHPLDNAVWHSLAVARPELAELTPQAGRYVHEVSPFSALPDEPTTEAWDALDRLVGDGVAVLFRRDIDPPAGWSTLFAGPGVQMVAARVEGLADESGVEPLGASDVPEMLELIRVTQPGPFGERTIEMGDYLGLRDQGRLVAMAGERLHPDGYTEISAVCTDEEHRGRGLATRLVRVLVHRIQSRGERAFLHAAADNETAIRLYAALGFETREVIHFAALRRDGA